MPRSKRKDTGRTSGHPRNETDPCDRRRQRNSRRIGNLQSNQPLRRSTGRKGCALLIRGPGASGLP
ncbi:uncharacterized protein N7482_010060 [Penicillium canariense]|uniref:Uncharacterized protein n=1 Tax=Penicillium canariense TaxID=189055 RepID=A0A9W9HLA1_9EURO|nr:uncharacterized protein N7482_010060 [Penicillium canariense]KAJ5150808.1 hypothetical protein N7482_010060 [Penicillium canariense]